MFISTVEAGCFSHYQTSEKHGFNLERLSTIHNEKRVVTKSKDFDFGGKFKQWQKTICMTKWMDERIYWKLLKSKIKLYKFITKYYDDQLLMETAPAETWEDSLIKIIEVIKVIILINSMWVMGFQVRIDSRTDLNATGILLKRAIQKKSSNPAMNERNTNSDYVQARNEMLLSNFCQVTVTIVK
ncbi:hypothetical protein NQ318_011790 [Aromia moschata]|uniref:Uncharacterized protein n=1 Tax=Aromia moschata TaxID=1265417 RepID=A0AAV8Y5D6_9CUCU|nr:hypothetical protein NQ318_011790 [Aromia moschata]